MSTLKIGFVGVGNMGQCAHLRNYTNLEGAEVVALAEPRGELAQRVARKYGVPRVYASAPEMLANESLDGLVAPQPFTHHGSLIAPLYGAGLPLLTEKPLASSIEVGRDMLRALESGGSWHMVGYHKRSDPATACALAEIERLKISGELGRMRYLRITMPPGDWIAGGFFDLLGSSEPAPRLAPDPPPSDMDAPTYQAYVQFVNFYIHQVNLLRFLFGEPYEVTYADPSGVLMAVQSRGGVAGVLEMAPYSTTIDWQESVLAGFDNGYVKLELPSPVALNRPGRVEFLHDPGHGAVPRTIVPQLPWTHAMRQQAINFVRAIRGEIEPPCQAAEALDDLIVARDYIRLWKGQ